MLQTLRPYVETAVAAYWASDWLQGLDTYATVLAWLKMTGDAMNRQATIPGTEPATQRALAERRAALPLKPKADQRPCDIGLFSDESAQLDLVDMARKG
jgi:hypothetical protein